MASATKKSSRSEFHLLFANAWAFYKKRFMLLALFSIPFILAFLIPAFVPTPTYISLGGLFIRTGSIPELSIPDLIITALAYGISLFIISDTIANLSLIVKSQKTAVITPSDVWKALSTYASRILYVSSIQVLFLVAFQLFTFDLNLQNLLFPPLALIVSWLFFFCPTAIVIDNVSTFQSIYLSIKHALRKPLFFVLWLLTGLVGLSVAKIVFSVLVPSFSGILVMVFNALILLPFLLVLQIYMYMEKYPLAK